MVFIRIFHCLNCSSRGLGNEESPSILSELLSSTLPAHMIPFSDIYEYSDHNINHWSTELT